MTKRILIVEDDEAIATGLALNLKLSGYVTTLVQDGEEALESLAREAPDLILLDINLPRKDGIALLSELRRAGDPTPVIIVSAREDEYDKVAALRLGADDYVTKPFSLAELMARVDAVLRRAGVSALPPEPAVPIESPVQDSAPAQAESPAGERWLRYANVVMDLATRTVTRDSQEVKLTRLEFELLSYLVQNPSLVFSRKELLRRVWGQHSGSQRTIDNFVAQLRGKLEADPEKPRHFITVRGSGYRFDP